ncbi:hypothetical protein PMAYCL1PPCAC_20997, partial [Pristionchus mayeri]
LESFENESTPHSQSISSLSTAMFRSLLLVTLVATVSAQFFQPPTVWPASHQLAYLGIPWNQGGKVKITIINSDGSPATNGNVPFNANPLILHKSTPTAEKYVIINRNLAGSVVEHNGQIVFGEEIKDQVSKAIDEPTVDVKEATDA